MNELFYKWIGAIGVSYSVDSDGIYIWENWDDKDVPSQSEIVSKKAELDDTWATLLYQRERIAEYPSNGDQWDMIYKDNLNSTTTHKDAVEAVKTKWPKNNTGPVE
jgi:hypothetical protein